MQRTGSIKFRGVFNFIKAALENKPLTSVVTYSSGNHGQAVALSAKILGLRATIVMPRDAPPGKVAATRDYGADIVEYDQRTQDPIEICQRFCPDVEDLFIHPYQEALIPAGEATAVIEFLEEIPDLQSLIVPADGGDLVLACALAAKHMNPDIKVYAAESKTARESSRELHKYEDLDVPLDSVIDSELPPLEDQLLQEHPLIDGIIMVDDEELIDTQIFILERMKTLTEPFGSQAAAALRFRKQDFSKERVGVLLTAGNADLFKLSLSLRRDPLLPEPGKGKIPYLVRCCSCKQEFDALDTHWCSCLAEERSLVCPHCASCSCKAPQQYRTEFWANAPQVLWDSRMVEHEGSFELRPNPLPYEVKRPTVLVVDDSRDLMRIAKHIISSLGYGTIHAFTGEEGLELAKMYLPNLIITDSLLPKMDGREMCRRLKESQETAGIKVVVTTALYTQSKYRSEAFRTFHVDEYLNKPLSFAELRGLLQKYLG
jgi:threonine dehydratase